MSVQVLLPGALADLIGGVRSLAVDTPHPTTVGGLLAAVRDRHPVLHRRLCDETGSLRRFVNIYVDGDDIRRDAGLQTVLREGATVQILPSVAGG